MTVLTRVASHLRRTWFAAHGVRFHGACRLGPHVSLERGFHAGRKGEIEVGSASEILQGACLHAWGGRIKLGQHVFVGPYAVVYGHGGVVLGDETLISMHCRILSSNHTVAAPGTMIRSQPDVLLPTRIGRDVWLGAGVTVLGGVTIGDGCVVGAGAVVTDDLPPNSIAVGTPARVVRERK